MVSSELKGSDAQSRLPVLPIPSIESPLDGRAISELEALLPDYIRTRRWYRAKTRTIAGVRIETAVPLAGSNSCMLITRLQYEDGGTDNYILAIRFGDAGAGQTPAEADELIATYRTTAGEVGNVSDAIFHPDFRRQLLAAFADETVLHTNGSALLFTQTRAFSQMGHSAGEPLDSSVSRAEQSNTSIIYGSKYILKLFRKIESGTNPDIEIGTFLTERGFKHTPAVLGRLEYRASDQTHPHAAAILQTFVPNQGDAWKYTLDALSGYFERGLKSREVPEPPREHVTDLMMQDVPPAVAALLGDYAGSARLLGIRTAQMHAALADPNGGPDFVPEPFGSAEGEALYREMLHQADIAFDVLGRKQSTLEPKAAANARQLLDGEDRVRQSFLPLRTEPITAVRIRFHGDYHLGQVLYTGSDFMIIDFEGEPARPLEERRSKGLAIRDIAGMVRSFQYAAYAALFGQVPGLSFGEAETARVETLARLWFTWASAIYLSGYFEGADHAEFVPGDPAERRMLLNAFLLHKALYEVAYELNNRPDWVRIPLGGILGLIG
jgi:maltose alpha-D-glucosyltransferase / alpha-amylase